MINRQTQRKTGAIYSYADVRLLGELETWKPQDSCFDNKTQLKLRTIKENQKQKVKLNTGDKREYQNKTGSNRIQECILEKKTE